MAKGLGHIMAVAALERARAAAEAGEAILCPFCGQQMEHNGVAFFCRSGRDDAACIEEDRSLRAWYYEHADEDTRDQGMSVDDFQGQILGGIVAGGKIAATLETRRGRNGRTNLGVFVSPSYDDKMLPMLLKRHGWCFMEWVKGFNE